MKIRKTDRERAATMSCQESGKLMAGNRASVSHLVKASLFCLACTATSMASGQDTIAMVDHSAAAISGSQAAPVAGSAIQGVEHESAASTTSAQENNSKSPITGLEPGTLALIGFGLLALAATRRNAR